MATIRFVILSIILFSVSGCGYRAFTEPELAYEPVDSNEVVRTIQYLDGQTEGPLYNISLTVPDGWVGTFETRNLGGAAYSFEFMQELEVDEDDEDLEPEDMFRYAPIFTVEALSRPQYWEQSGSYPEQYVNVKFTADTYFIYSVLPDAYYSGLPDDEYAEFTAAIPEIMASFNAERVDADGAILTMP